MPPGSSIERHTHPGEEAVYVLNGATLEWPDGKEVSRPTGEAEINVRDVPHAGYKVVGDKPLKLLTVHIVDKGKPMTAPEVDKSAITSSAFSNCSYIGTSMTPEC